MRLITNSSDITEASDFLFSGTAIPDGRWFAKVVFEGKFFIFMGTAAGFRVYQSDTIEECQDEFDRLGRDLDRLNAMRNAIRNA
jgi:hypothetical protein